MVSHDQQKIQSFMMEHPGVNFDEVYKSFQDSQYGTYDLTSKDFSFKTVIYIYINFND